MDPAWMKMTLLVFIAAFAMRARSQTEHSIGSYATSETERCVCQPHVTINPPVCGRSVPVNSGNGCNCTTVQVSSELGDTRRKMDELQVAVSTKLELVTSELGVMGRHVGELQESVSALMKLLNGGLLIQWPPKDCSDIYARGVTHSGAYEIEPLYSGQPFLVYCDMDTDGGGWTVFQRRLDGSVDFYLDFANYSRGFGNQGEFWLGNDNLHRLTAQGEYELRIDILDFENESRYAVYDSFSIADVNDNYRLRVGNYSGTAGDSLSYSNNRQFSTKDRDNDASGGNCAQSRHGAWWFGACLNSNLNGPYLNGTTTEFARGVVWYHWKGYDYSLKTSEMKIRPTPQ